MGRKYEQTVKKKKQGSAAARQPRISLKFKLVWMLLKFVWMEILPFWVGFRISANFQNCKGFIFLKLKAAGARLPIPGKKYISGWMN